MVGIRGSSQPLTCFSLTNCNNFRLLITSLDSGIHALAHFVSPSDHPSAWFKVMLVAAIGSITLVLLSLGGTAALATIQTGAILGALPFSFICLLMIYNFIHNLINDRLPGTFILSQDRMNR